MEMYRRNIRPRDIMTKDAIMNALTVDMALGCSTNSMLHLPAIAHEIGFDFDITFAIILFWDSSVAEISVFFSITIH